ncbi:interleukin-6 receptor subunit beta-like [Chanos chanos]|uniref:Interleukin-6 receptor subunit beta-like n=1 Tax=Chanos chanos TaxID=29144 RepID=A0A6J2UVI4_CHACN|nr:interleukin-6 receptor subunit beta-like [Chanos chanos]
MIRIGLLVIFLVTHGKGQDSCEILPKQPTVKMGSDLVVLFHAPPNGDCRKQVTYSSNRVYWRFNNKAIEKSYYRYNSTFAAVSIHNITLKVGTIECLIDDIVLGGTIIRAYSPPQNIHCVTLNERVKMRATCYWDHDRSSENTKYTVQLKQEGKPILKCISSERDCQFTESISMAGMNITVCAENPRGVVLCEEAIYNDFYLTLKPSHLLNVHVEPQSNGSLKVSWLPGTDTVKSWKHICEIQSIQESSNAKTVKKIEWIPTKGMSSYTIDGVQPCSKYTVSLRCALSEKYPWSDWSQPATALSELNVNTVLFQLLRTKDVPQGNGMRQMHLMWKGVPPSCGSFEYRLFVLRNYTNSTSDMNAKFERFTSTQNHTIITVDREAHTLLVAAYHNNVMKGKSSLQVPTSGEDFDLPPVNNLTAVANSDQIDVSWVAPALPVSSYMIVWNSTRHKHQWQQTQETCISLTAQPSHLYKISVSPLYGYVPGLEKSVLMYSKEGEPASVWNVHIDDIRDNRARIRWQLVSPIQCCAFVVNYTVFYKAESGPELNMTVGRNQNKVILDQLQPGTRYDVYIEATSFSSSSKSDLISFQTKPLGELASTLIILGGVVSVPIFVLIGIILTRKFLSKVIPDPRYSSVSMWSSQQCRKIQHLPQTASCMNTYSEAILPCRIETIERDISSAEWTSTEALHNCEEDQISTFSHIASISSLEKEDTVLVSSQSKWVIPTDCVQNPSLEPSHDFHLQLDCTVTPYLNQTPVVSPVETPEMVLGGSQKLCISQETEALLKSDNNGADGTTYIMVG